MFKSSLRRYRKVYILDYSNIVMVDKKCPYCEKMFSGQSDKQIDYLILIHKLSKHPDKIEIREKTI